MSRKIFNAIWSVALIVFIASLTFIMGATYNYFSSVQQDQLEVETQLAARGVEENGLAYFDGLEASNYRITWISDTGEVLYDNEANTDEMENHLEREEVQEALSNGYGESSRYSSTMSEKEFYYAKLLDDGTILRLSCSQVTIWTLLLRMLAPIILVASIVLVLSLILALKLSNKIVEPINNIDPEHPLNYINNEDVKEIEPLLKKMDSLQEEIKIKQDEIERASLIRQEFSANASHELKTPLHAISGYAELLENQMVKQNDIVPFAKKIHQEAQRLSILVEDIINLTKLDSAKTIKKENVDLYLVSKNAIDSIQSAADAKKITISLQGESTIIYGVPQLTYSVVYNLCDNAVKYNKVGGIVEVTIINLPNEVELKVKDTGIGIPKEYQDRIFERFFRVDKSRSKENGGTGLGLSIVKHALMIMDGKIKVVSTINEGSTFIVSFPKNENKNS